MIPVTEFARRLCEAEHPFKGAVGQAPCSEHLAQAHRLWGLLSEEGTGPLTVVLAVRLEAGLPVPEPVHG